ncbi:hypothetical protein AB0K12_42620 [Nonomuraea sp. NPDC049419]|uniref:hypothetical protein n=1 Tax=Nonomuraea sp. NPDC049419 TaxID=3155772 RepID=UPI00342F19B0
MPLPASETGTWLAKAGMDVSLSHRLIAEDRLACWVQAYADKARRQRYVGHAVASWEDARRGAARLDLVQTRPGVPAEVRGALVHAVVRTVAEEGALRVVTAIDDPGLHAYGFQAAAGGGLVFGTVDTEPPPGRHG